MNYCFCINTDIVTVDSLSVPQCGEKYRSSNNFQVTMTDTYFIKVSQEILNLSPDLQFKIMEDISGDIDQEVGLYQNGYGQAILEVGKKYYISDPVLAFTKFTVILEPYIRSRPR